MRRAFSWPLITALVFCAVAPSLAQQFPSKPIHIVVPFAPGGVDVTARLLQPVMQQALGQPIVIENRPGAGGVTGSVAVAHAAPDGYTLLMTASGSLISTPLLAKNPAFNPLTDFTPITVVFQAVSTLAVRAGLPFESVQELIGYARRHPGKLSYASPGIGTNQHMEGEVFKATAGVDIVHVPYKGFGPAIADLVAGHVDMGFITYANIRPQLASGKVRIVAVGDSARYAGLPQTPTIAETLPTHVKVPGWSGALLGPPGLAQPIVARLNAAAVKAAHSPEALAKLEEGGSLLIANAPEEFAALLKSDLERVRGIVTRLGIRIEE